MPSAHINVFGNWCTVYLRGGRDSEPVLAAVTDFPAATRLQPHGLYLSNASDSLYVGRRQSRAHPLIFYIKHLIPPDGNLIFLHKTYEINWT